MRLTLIDAEEQPAIAGPAAHRVRRREQPGSALVHRLGAVDDLLVDRCDAEQRQHADDRANPDRLDVAVGKREPVVEEAVALVPEALRLERVGDQREVLEELQDEVARPVGRALFRTEAIAAIVSA